MVNTISHFQSPDMLLFPSFPVAEPWLTPGEALHLFPAKAAHGACGRSTGCPVPLTTQSSAGHYSSTPFSFKSCSSCKGWASLSSHCPLLVFRLLLILLNAYAPGSPSPALSIMLGHATFRPWFLISLASSSLVTLTSTPFPYFGMHSFLGLHTVGILQTSHFLTTPALSFSHTHSRYLFLGFKTFCTLLPPCLLLLPSFPIWEWQIS